MAIPIFFVDTISELGEVESGRGKCKIYHLNCLMIIVQKASSQKAPWFRIEKEAKSFEIWTLADLCKWRGITN